MGARGTAAEQLIQQGFEKGLEQGLQQAIQQGYEKALVDPLPRAVTTTLSVRGLPMSALTQGSLASCTDADTLLRWLARAATASSEVEVLGDGEGR